GLTKGQYSPTSEPGKVTKSSPMGSLDHPFNTLSLALGAEGTFVARALDSDRKGLTEVLDAAARHRGTSFIEILQDCPIFNDGSFDLLRKENAGDHLIAVRHGEKIIFGDEGQHCVVRNGFSLTVAATADVDESDIIVHDAHSPDPAPPIPPAPPPRAAAPPPARPRPRAAGAAAGSPPGGDRPRDACAGIPGAFDHVGGAVLVDPDGSRGPGPVPAAHPDEPRGEL